MTISDLNTTGWSHGSYCDDLYEILKRREKDSLKVNGINGGFQHDSRGLPTIGYGFNVAAPAHTAEAIEAAITYALGGTPTTLARDGLDIVPAWKNGTPIDAAIDFGGGDQLELVGVPVSVLGTTDFIFARAMERPGPCGRAGFYENTVTVYLFRQFASGLGYILTSAK